MTDLEKWQQILSQSGIPYKTTNNVDFIEIEIEVDKEIVMGYWNFTFELIFNLDKSFRECGVWE